MRGDIVPNRDHIARYCKFTQIHPDDGSIDGSAFVPRAGEDYLSVNWLEYFKLLTQGEQLNKIRHVLSTKLTVKASAKIAVLNVGVTCAQGLLKDHEINVIHEPITPPPIDDPSHSGIYGVSNEELGDLLAQNILYTTPAKDS